MNVLIGEQAMNVLINGLVIGCAFLLIGSFLATALAFKRPPLWGLVRDCLIALLCVVLSVLLVFAAIKGFRPYPSPGEFLRDARGNPLPDPGLWVVKHIERLERENAELRALLHEAIEDHVDPDHTSGADHFIDRVKAAVSEEKP